MVTWKPKRKSWIDGSQSNMRNIACLWAVLVCPIFAQNPQDLLSFEVATLKLHPPGSPEGTSTTQSGGPGTSDPGRITIVNRTLHRLLIEAYVLKGYQLQDPPSLDQVRYDIVAKVPAGATAEDARIMMQNLLIERLKLKIRREHQVVPVWALVVAKGGPKFKPSSETAAASRAQDPADSKAASSVRRIVPATSNSLLSSKRWRSLSRRSSDKPTTPSWISRY